MEVSKIDGRIRFCAFQTFDGLRRHYICGHQEYCCALGCCLSTAFSFYQLWYFWLLLLLILLLCSGGGWWFRWRHGGMIRQSTPLHVHGGNSGPVRVNRRAHPHRTPRVYPHPYYGNAERQHPDACTLPPGYDKDPPAYNEVISRLHQFPRVDRGPDIPLQAMPVSSSTSNTEQSSTPVPGPSTLTTNSPTPITGHPPVISGPLGSQTAAAAPPPPSYEMVLELKRKEEQLNREIEEEEQDRNSTTGRIRNLLRGRSWRRRPEQQTEEEGTVGSRPSYSASSGYVASSLDPSEDPGVFTISREDIPAGQRYHPDEVPDSPSIHSSHSDYSSSFLSSPSNSSRLFSPVGHNIEEHEAPIPFIQATDGDVDPWSSPDRQINHNLLEAPESTSRPCTGRSVLSRPVTSISQQSLPVPPQPLKERKTSLPGALLEADSEVPPYPGSLIIQSPGTSIPAALGRLQELPEPHTQRDNRAIDNT